MRLVLEWATYHRLTTLEKIKQIAIAILTKSYSTPLPKNPSKNASNNVANSSKKAVCSSMSRVAFNSKIPMSSGHRSNNQKCRIDTETMLQMSNWDSNNSSHPSRETISPRKTTANFYRDLTQSALTKTKCRNVSSNAEIWAELTLWNKALQLQVRVKMPRQMKKEVWSVLSYACSRSKVGLARLLYHNHNLRLKTMLLQIVK